MKEIMPQNDLIIIELQLFIIFKLLIILYIIFYKNYFELVLK
jgi:hypothetical protein